jgi:hypothetical protein
LCFWLAGWQAANTGFGLFQTKRFGPETMAIIHMVKNPTLNTDGEIAESRVKSGPA